MAIWCIMPNLLRILPGSLNLLELRQIYLKTSFSAADIERLAILPSKEVLISTLAGMLQLPISRLVKIVIDLLEKNLVVVLEAVGQKKKKKSINN